MKKSILLFALPILLLGSLSAQETIEDNEPIIIGDSEPREEMSTLVNRRGSHGIYLGLSAGYNQINGSNVISSSVKLAYVIDTKLEIGFQGYALHSENGIASFSNEDLYLVAALGGLHIEPILFGRKTIHFSFPIFLGGGASYLYEGNRVHEFPSDPWEENFEPLYEEWEPVLVAQPGVNAVVNISRFLQLEVGGKYRLSTDLQFSDPGLENLNGASFNVGLKIGFFDFGRR